MTESTPDKFARLAERWRRDTAHLSSVDDAVSHTAYQEIIRMGRDAVPLMIAELRKTPEHWFPALRIITGENPVREADAGRVQAMADAWVAWWDWMEAWSCRYCGKVAGECLCYVVRPATAAGT